MSESILEHGAPIGNHNLPWPERQAQLTALNQWNAQGSIGAHSVEKGWNASFNWQQQPNDYTIQIFGPLGINRIQLAGNSQQVTLQTASQTYNATSPELLIQQQLGWKLPVSNLYYWLRGLPAPNSRFTRSFDMNHHIVHLQQDGWDLKYLRYLSIKGIDLPDRILLSNSRWQIRIVVTDWQLQ